MTINEYTQKADELHQELRILRDLYIDEHKPCSKDQKILVTEGNKQTKGIVTGFKINIHSGAVEIIAEKLKKDGNPMGVKLYIWSHSKVEYIN